MTYPRPSGSRTTAPLTPAAPLLASPVHVNAAPVAPPSSAVGPRPGQPGFIGATTHGNAPQQDRRRRRSPLAWLPWALLAVLLGLVLLMVLAGSLVGRDSDKSNSSSRAAAVAASPAGTLVSEGGDLLAGTGSLDRLRDLNGKAVVGRNVLVQSVVADEGFWVGRSVADRTFVYLTPQARKGDGESPFQVRAGQHVEIDGTVGILGPDGAGRLGVTDTEGARQLTSQKGYVVAKSVRLSS